MLFPRRRNSLRGATHHSTFPNTQHACSIQRVLGCRLFNELVSENDGIEVEFALFMLLLPVVGILFTMILFFITLVNFCIYMYVKLK